MHAITATTWLKRLTLPLLLLASCAAHAATATPDALEQAVNDVCNKQLVVLGEDANHGGGHTLQTKVELVRRLREHCGFSALMFEAQIYDFVDLQQDFARGQGSREQLTDAIGGLWSTTAELDPLLDELLAPAVCA